MSLRVEIYKLCLLIRSLQVIFINWEFVSFIY